VKTFLDQILREKRIAYAVFDEDLILREHSREFARFMNRGRSIPQQPVWDVFRELIGSEDMVEEVLRGPRKRYRLQKLNHVSASGRLRTYDLTLMPLKKRDYAARLLCVVADTTEQTSMEQAIRQQKFEIQLLQANLSSYGKHVGGEILGESPQIACVREFIRKIAPIRNTTVLLHGETGTGKNLVARAIHQASMLPDAPFVEINCASIPETLLESEIFGYEKAAPAFRIPDDGISFFELEKNVLLEALRKSGGNQSKAARLLQLSLDTFRYRLKKYHILH